MAMNTSQQEISPNLPAGQKVTIIMGPPGSGKGTQAVRISKHLNVPHISTGDLLRKNIKEQTKLGEKAQKYMDSGQYVPDYLVLDMLFDRVAKEDCKNGYVLDGVPRTLAQAKALDRRFENTHAEINIIYLSVPDEVVLERLGGRLTCKHCGHIHHKLKHPPQNEGVCDVCGGTLEQRNDDKVEVIIERLNVYRKHTEPVVDYYKKSHHLHILDGEAKADEVFGELVSFL